LLRLHKPEAPARRGVLLLAPQISLGFTADPFGPPEDSVFAILRRDEAELDRAFSQLSAGGTVLMPPGNYGFSMKFAWLNDRFGVSWQLNLQ
jgi:uncharacterized glyoxalase superfamily protein PhnB